MRTVPLLVAIAPGGQKLVHQAGCSKASKGNHLQDKWLYKALHNYAHLLKDSKPRNNPCVTQCYAM